MCHQLAVRGESIQRRFDDHGVAKGKAVLGDHDYLTGKRGLHRPARQGDLRIWLADGEIYPLVRVIVTGAGWVKWIAN